MVDASEVLNLDAKQEVVFVPMILHGRLIKILAEAGAKRGKTVKQLVTDAILEKADTLYKEDQESENGGQHE